MIKWLDLCWWLPVVTAFALLMGCTYVSGGVDEGRPLRISILDVGQGLSILFEQDGYYGLFDMGPDSVGVLDTLRNRGVDTLEWVVVSHNHRDHGGGFLELGGRRASEPRVHIKHLYVGPDTSGGFIRDSIIAISRQNRIPLDTLRRGDELRLGPAIAGGTAPGPRFEILWPPSYRTLGGNGASLVLEVSNGAGSALFMADADTAAERELLELHPTITADMLQVGHHGSAGSSSLKFLSQVSPRFAVVSVGARNRYGHPAKEVLQKLLYVVADSARVYRTDEHGTLEFEMVPSVGVME